MSPLLLALVESGVVSLADAERIDRSTDPAAARAHSEQMLTDAFARGLTAQQRRILGVLDEAQGNPTPRALERLWAQENELLWASVGDDLRDVATEQAVRASIGAVDANTWMLVNEEVVNWVDQTYTSTADADFGSIPNLNQTSRTQFADAFQRWQLGDRTPGNYAQGLPQLLAELQPIFGRARAERIGVTETTRVFSQSELAAGNANPFVEAWLYNTANDSYVSELCRSGEGAIMLKGESVFSDGKGPPPRHVRCRSSVTQLTGPALAALREEGFVQPGRGPLPVVGTAEDDGVGAQSIGDYQLELAVQERKGLAERVKDISYDTGEGKRVREKMFKAQEKTDERVRAIWEKYRDRKREARRVYLDTLSQFGEGDPRTVKAAAAADKLFDASDKEVAAARAKGQQAIFISDKERKWDNHMRYEFDPTHTHVPSGTDPTPTDVLPQHKIATEFVNKVTSLGLGGDTRVRYVPERAHAEIGFNRVQLATSDETWVAVHEMGHIIEYAAKSKQRQLKVQRFLHDRIGDDAPMKLRDVSDFYGETEIAYKDKFESAYVGRVYAKWEATEVVSMGMQYLYQDAVAFAQKDPGYFDFIVSYLRDAL